MGLESLNILEGDEVYGYWVFMPRGKVAVLWKRCAVWLLLIAVGDAHSVMSLGSSDNAVAATWDWASREERTHLHFIRTSVDRLDAAMGLAEVLEVIK
jgi:hypothetical protein